MNHDDVENSAGQTAVEPVRPFQWPPPNEDLAAIEVVDATTLRRVDSDRPPVMPMRKRNRRMARRLVRLRRSTSSPVLTVGATLFCLALFAFLEVRSELMRPPVPSAPIGSSASMAEVQALAAQIAASQVAAAQLAWAQAEAVHHGVPRDRAVSRQQPDSTPRVSRASRAVSKTRVPRQVDRKPAPRVRAERADVDREPPPPQGRFATFVSKTPKAIAKPFTAFWRSLKRGPNETRASREARAAREWHSDGI